MTDGVHRWLLGGGIGSGKSTVRRHLAEAGIDTIDADSIGHSILEPGGAAFDRVVSGWPSVVRDGRIDRGALAAIVFSDADELSDLERMTHPLIFGAISDRVEQIMGTAVVEIPLLRKAPPGEWKRLVVDCEDSIRLERLIKRGLSEEDAMARMAAQPSRAQWLAVADLVIPNHGSPDDLERAVGLALPALTG